MNERLTTDSWGRRLRLWLRNVAQSATRFLPRRGPLVLMYHSVGTNSEFHAIVPAVFEQQMAMLRASGRPIVSVQNLLERDSSSVNAIAVTFDDGYMDNFEHAAPILSRYSIPASFFIATGFVGGIFPGRRERGHAMMDWAQMREMKATGLFEFYPHGERHLKLDLADPMIAYDDIRRSIIAVNNELGTTRGIFAYPYGRSNESIRTMVHDLGMRYAFGIIPGPLRTQRDNLELNRNSVDRHTSLAAFRGIIHFGRL